MLSSPSAPSIAIGELLWDLLPSGPRLGGTTTNFAVLSARLGESSALVSCVGDDDLGRKASEILRSLALDTTRALGAGIHLNLSGIQTSVQLPTGTVSVELDSAGRPQYSISSPVAWDGITLTPLLMELAQSASVICFGTLAQRYEESRRSIRGFIQAAGTTCLRVCDLNLRGRFCSQEILSWSLSQADVLKVSDEELPEVGRLLGEPTLAAGFSHVEGTGANLTTAAGAAASALLELAPQCRLVAITLGPYGSVLADRVDTHRHIGIPVAVADTIGAGDAFTAGLVHSYVRGADLAQISEIANLCGSYVASQPGATPTLPPTLIESIEAALF